MIELLVVIAIIAISTVAKCAHSELHDIVSADCENQINIQVDPVESK